MPYRSVTLDAYIKGKSYAQSLIRQAKRERDMQGYRENMGYDLQGKLEKRLDKLVLTPADRERVIDYFRDQCEDL